MRKFIPMPRPRPLRVLGSVVVLGAVLGGELAAAEPPAPWPWFPGRPVPPHGRFFEGPILPRPVPIPIPTPYSFRFQAPNPFPVPIPPELSDDEVTGPTDRCLVIAPPIDPRSVRTASVMIDPGIFARPRVQGLSVRPSSMAGWSPRR